MKNSKPFWKPISIGSMVFFTLSCLLLLILLITDDNHFLFIVDHANLAFHEAGHPIFGLLGNTLGLYGGTLGQLVFPVVTAVVFMRQQNAIAFATSTAWLFENFTYIATYMGDARAQVLPLVGGGEHDWFAILSRWGLLNADTTLSKILTIFAYIGIVLTALWVVYIWVTHRDLKNSDDRIQLF